MSKALVLREKGSWTNLHVEDREVPHATENTAVVKVRKSFHKPAIDNSHAELRGRRFFFVLRHDSTQKKKKRKRSALLLALLI
jgi:hypothetical protein